MSQIVTQENLMELKTSPAINQRDVIVLSDVVREFQGEIRRVDVNVSTRIRKSHAHEKVLVAPTQLKNAFKEYYTRFVSMSSTTNILSAKKEAFVETVQQMNYVVSDEVKAKSRISKVLEARSEEQFEELVNITMNEVQKEHSDIVVKHFTQQIIESAEAIKFADEIKVVTAEEKTIITAFKENRAIVNEIKTDAITGKIRLDTASLGFEGKTCDVVMKAFLTELEKRGMKFSGKTKKWTGDSSWVPTQKANNKSTSTRRSVKEFASIRKLNSKINRS